MIETERSPAASTTGKSSRALRVNSLPQALPDGLIAFAVIVGLLRLSEVAAGVPAFATLTWVARRRPDWLHAFALTGTFVYLGALTGGGLSPHSSATRAYDAMLVADVRQPLSR